MWSNSWIPKVLPPSEDHGYQSGQVGGSVMLWWIPSLGMSVCAISHECRLHIWQGMVCPKWHLNCQENPSLKWPWQSPKDLALVQIWAHPELMDSFIPRPSFQTFSLRPHPRMAARLIHAPSDQQRSQGWWLVGMSLKVYSGQGYPGVYETYVSSLQAVRILSFSSSYSSLLGGTHVCRQSYINFGSLSARLHDIAQSPGVAYT